MILPTSYAEATADGKVRLTLMSETGPVVVLYLSAEAARRLGPQLTRSALHAENKVHGYPPESRP